MKALIATSFTTVALFAGTAHAQLFSEVRFGESFELDAYATEKRELAEASPYPQWLGNPNVKQTSSSSPQCFLVPGRLNTLKGETVLSAEPTSLIYKLLSSLGQTHSHSGMARDAFRIRHNTMFEHAVDVNDDASPPRLKATGAESLRDGYPGTITHSVEAALTHNEFNLIDGLVLGLGGTGPQIVEAAGEMSNADGEMADFRGYYRFYAFTNMTWNDPYTRSYNDGSMCSGSIFFAHLNAGNRGWSWSQRRSYSAEVRQPAAELLYAQVRHAVIEELEGTTEGLGLDFLDLFGDIFGTSTGRGETARAIGNQMVNCMAFNDCGNVTTRWQQGVGSGRSLSPDDLYLLAFVAAYNAAMTGTTNTFVYTSAKPVQKTGDYLCCRRGGTQTTGTWPFTETQQLSYTQCLKQY